MDFFPEDVGDVKKYTGCLLCPLASKNKTDVVRGNGKKGIVLLLPPVTDSEVMYRDVLSTSQSYPLLARLFKDTIDVDVDEDCYAINSILCPGYRKAKNQTTIQDNCRETVINIIKSLNPKLIFSVGADSLKVLFNHIYKDTIKADMNLWRGFNIPHKDLGVYVCPIYPQFDLYKTIKDGDNGTKRVEVTQRLVLLSSDLKYGYNNYYGKPIPSICHTHLDHIKLLYTPNEVKELLEGWLNTPPKLLTFDYEASGLKPRGKGKHLICISICDGKTSYAFMLNGKGADHDYNRELLKQLLSHQKIGFIAHNMKFEKSWSKVHLGVDHINFKYDPCIGQHFLDNRSGITGLKFQTFVYAGVGDYSSHTANYICGTAEKVEFNDGPKWKSYSHGNLINKMDEFPVAEILTYCALDSLFTHYIYTVHMDKYEHDSFNTKAFNALYGYDLLHKGTLALGEIEDNGFRVDSKYLETTMRELKKEAAELKDKLYDLPLVKEWRDYAGKAFNLDSGPQLGKFLFDHKRYVCEEYTEKGEYATDAEALAKLELPELDMLIKYKKMVKVTDTFLKGIWFEKNDDTLHCSFNSNMTVTYRLSSSDPNLQNVPKRDKFQKNAVRRAFLPHPGQFLIEVDYKNLEVFGALAYHHDPVARHYLENPEADQHTDNTFDIFMRGFVPEKEGYALLTDGDKKASARNLGKTFNFASQYGASPINTAKILWSKLNKGALMDGTALDVWVKEKCGITTESDWEARVVEAHNRIFRERFKVQSDWQKTNYWFYLKHGYVDSYSGFRFTGDYTSNNVNNYPIQGFSSNIVLYCLVKLQRFINERGLKTKIVSTIHDSIIVSVEPSEVQVFMPYLDYVCNKGCYKHFPFFEIPSPIDYDAGEIDADWSTLKGTSLEKLLEKYK